jgi:hypothetical protein
VDRSAVTPDTVAWAVENAQTLLRDETDRVRSLDGKAGQLAGFAGVTLAVLGSIAPDALSQDLGRVGDPVFAAAFFGAAGFVTGSIIWLVFLVLRPQRFVAIDAKEIRNYLQDDRLLRAEPWALQMRTLRALGDSALWAQRAGEQKASRLGVGVTLFGIGLGTTLVAILTLGVANL